MLTAIDTMSTQFGLNREEELRSLLDEVLRLNAEDSSWYQFGWISVPGTVLVEFLY